MYPMLSVLAVDGAPLVAVARDPSPHARTVVLYDIFPQLFTLYYVLPLPYDHKWT